MDDNTTRNGIFKLTGVKALANEDTLLRTHCCRHRCFHVCPRARNICCGHKFCVRDTKNVLDFVQKHFVSATNVSQFTQYGNTTFILCPARCTPKKHHDQQCVRSNVSSFARALTCSRRTWHYQAIYSNIEIQKIPMKSSSCVTEVPTHLNAAYSTEMINDSFSWWTIRKFKKTTTTTATGT